ncbi:MAG: O-antigen ligase family protein [Arenimonas sp.]
MPTSPEATFGVAPVASAETRGFRWAPAFVVAYVALLPTVGVAEGVLVLGALIALGLLLWQRFRGGTRLLSREAWALTTALFFAYWAPELFSAFDAINRAEAWGEVAKDLRYLPFLWLTAMAMASARGRRWVGLGLGVVVLSWTADALMQAATGVSIGGPATADRLSGIFGADNLKLGLILCSLSPYALETLHERFGVGGWLAGAVLVGIVILLGGARAAWLGYAIVLGVSGWRVLRSKSQLAMVLGIGLVVAVAGWYLSPQFRGRIERSVTVVTQGDADNATSGRMSLWKVAGAMALDHPVNGVGARNFRDAYRSYAPPDDFFTSKGEGALHAHQVLLEILTETGLIGLLLWLAGALLAWRAWTWASPAARERARVPALALGVTVFPFNTHLAFYSTFWGGVFLLLVALFAGSLLAGDEDVRAPAA